jgi:probable addiction module antidote protein
MPKRTRSFKAGQLERLKDPSYAAEYVNAAIEGSDNAALLLALRNVAEAQSVTTVAHQAGVSRENVYRMLSETGNPCYTSLQGILGALGLRLSIQPMIQGQSSKDMHRYACAHYSPLVWEIKDRPDRCLPQGFGGFSQQGFYWRECELRNIVHPKGYGESLDLELVA